MSREQMDTVTSIYRNSPLDLGGDVTKMRVIFKEMLTAAPVAADVDTEQIEIGGIPAVSIRVGEGKPSVTILYFHGGVYAMGSGETSVGLAADIARRSSSHVISVDYRLAPEHPYPAATDDALAAYRGLLDEVTDSSSIAISGDSAGAGLALATALAARQAGLRLPDALVLLSPWADLTQSGASMQTKAEVDPTITAAALQVRADDYLAGADPRGPLASPIFADLSGMPAMLIQVGSHEVLLDDAVRLAAKAATDDINVILDVIAGAPHVSQSFAGILEEAASALDRVAAFLATHAR
jgi:monoterpene epsilon-lactone hydrolase